MKKRFKNYIFIFGMFIFEILLLIFLKFVYVKNYEVLSYVLAVITNLICLYLFRKNFNLNFQFKVNEKIKILRSKTNLIIVSIFLLLYIPQIIILPYFNRETIVENIWNLSRLFLLVLLTDLIYYRYYLFLKKYSRKVQRIIELIVWLFIVFSFLLFILLFSIVIRNLTEVKQFIFLLLMCVFGVPLRERFYYKELRPYVFGVFKNVNLDEDDDKNTK